MLRLAVIPYILALLDWVSQLGGMRRRRRGLVRIKVEVSLVTLANYVHIRGSVLINDSAVVV